ncbi:MAG: heavy metal-binding domain-containing protein [Bacteroidota bacterium]|nr:heavy metal-binding domain-containing protein [Bacteroidota bacterium]
MKNLTLFIISFAILSIYACSGESNPKQSTETDTVQTETHHTDEIDASADTTIGEEADKKPAQTTVSETKYICPNSCPEGRLNTPGSCPLCGMELIENPDFSMEE